MGFLKFIFGDRNKLPFSKVFEFERVKSDFQLKIGDEMSLWNKPNTTQVNFYARGSVAGRGLVGSINNSVICNHLANTKYLFVENRIVGLTRNRIKLYVNMYTNEQVVIQNSQEQVKSWINIIHKKYSPKTNWEIRFFSEVPIKTSHLKIETVPKDLVHKFYDKKDEAIWLTNRNGIKVSAENRIRKGGTEKTLRVLYTGHELEIKSITNNFPWYYLIVGIKK